ncbi:secreted protein-like protein [Halenospora varia]|nr:secreted protein-like protein [Halenospora varia]
MHCTSLNALLVAASLATTTLATPIFPRTAPNIPTAAAAKTALAALTVAAQGPQTGYSRDLFPTWNTISGTCNTRETVLKRDGTNVVVNSACASTSGSWYSVYDGATWTAASDVDIDHMVPLSNAWKSGAASWTTAQRQAFANDLTNPQLLAVTDNVNQAKSDSGPEDWKPPLTSFYCTYARMWVKVKSVYALTITSAEKTALTSMLNTC